MAGDIYAHRTIVTTNMIGQFHKDDFKEGKSYKKFEEFKSDVATEQIEFRKIADYTVNLKKGDDTSESTNKYEDNVDFISSRYTNAKKCVRQLLIPGEKYDFRTKNWNDSALPQIGTLTQYEGKKENSEN